MLKLKEKLHYDRCCNPFNKKGHKGKDLRRVSEGFISQHPDIPKNFLICQACRKLNNGNSAAFARSTDESDVPMDESDVPMDESISELQENETVQRDYVENVSIRKDKLEQTMNALKEKFASLPDNDPLRVSILTIFPDCWSLRDIMQEFNVSIRMAKKARDLRDQCGILATPKPKKGKSLPESTINKVLEYYDSDTNSRVLPNKKDVVKIKKDDRIIHVPKRLLLFDIKILFRNFKEENKETQISFTKFAELRPKWCVVAGARGTHSVCVCTIHQNFKAMFDASNLVELTKELSHQLHEFRDCIKYCLCRNPKPECYLRTCEKCPKLLDFEEYVTSVLLNNDVENIIYSIWVATDKCTLKKECHDVYEFVPALSDSLQSLIPHHFLSKKQSEFFKSLKNNLKPNEGVLEIDFSENYAYVAQNAAQQFHYNNDQCSIFSCVLNYKEGQEVKHCSFILLSDCTTHDTTAVYLAQTHLIPAILKKVPKLKKLIYISDGAKQHFKNRFQMSNLVHHKDDFGIEAEWHNNTTAHGKGSCDGLGAVLKSLATRASLQDKGNEAILNATQLFDWAKNKFPNISFFYYTKQDYERTARKLNKRFSIAPAVPNISKAHAFKVSKKKLLAYRYSESTEVLSTTSF